MSRSYKFSPLQQQIASALEEAREEDIVCLACTVYRNVGDADPARFLLDLRQALEWLHRLKCVSFYQMPPEPKPAISLDEVVSAIRWSSESNRFVAAATAPPPAVTLTDQGFEAFFPQ
jgi:hypothetical protein